MAEGPAAEGWAAAGMAAKAMAAKGSVVVAKAAAETGGGRGAEGVGATAVGTAEELWVEDAAKAVLVSVSEVAIGAVEEAAEVGEAQVAPEVVGRTATEVVVLAMAGVRSEAARAARATGAAPRAGAKMVAEMVKAAEKRVEPIVVTGWEMVASTVATMEVGLLEAAPAGAREVVAASSETSYNELR